MTNSDGSDPKEASTAEAGLKGTRRDEDGNIYLGDVVVAIDGKRVRNLHDLNDIMQQHQVGDNVTITIVRDGERQDVQVTLRARPQ